MSEFELVTTEPMTVAFCSMRGPYAQIPEGLGRLYRWLGARGLNPVGMPTAVYLTAPAEVPEQDAQWEVWAPVAGRPEVSAPDADSCGIKEVPSTLVVSSMHRGPYDTIGSLYERMQQFIAEQGYAPSGPPMERYYSDPKEVPPEEYLTEVLIPVSAT